jgi:riboflavin biosynthesis pyrimidine reductase
MTDPPQIRRLWPDPSTPPLDDAALAALYGRPGRSHLRVNFVTSLDGAVELGGRSGGLSGPADKRVFGLLRMLCDAVLVGAGTLRRERYRAVRLDERRRAWRWDSGLTELPTLVVVSQTLALDPAQAAFADAPVRPLVFTTAKAVPPPGLTEVAEVLPVAEDKIDLLAVVAELHRRGLNQVLCEGGPLLFGALTAADLVDELCLTVSPQLVGAGAGRIVAGSPSPPRTLRLAHTLAAEETLLLRYVRTAAGPASG